tara:strand:+ start:92 stop:448 length:357 start_codon:yes stop_codon:yes gene_type:complete
MILIGNDIVDISKFDKIYSIYKDRFINRIFNSDEIEYCNSKKNPILHFSGKFAAKEAVKKTFNKNIFLKNISILNKDNGKPFAVVENCEICKFDLSISHTDTYATAIAINYMNIKHDY